MNSLFTVKCSPAQWGAQLKSFIRSLTGSDSQNRTEVRRTVKVNGKWIFNRLNIFFLNVIYYCNSHRTYLFVSADIIT